MTGERNRKIQFDLNFTPLQIYTDSKIGSGDVMWVQFFASSGGVGISVRFDSTPNYYIGLCVQRTVIPQNNLGKDNDRIWTIEKHGTRLKLLCNGVEIFNYETETSSENDCKDRWTLDFIKIRFTDNTANNGNMDTASDLYRQHITGKSFFDHNNHI